MKRKIAAVMLLAVSWSVNAQFSEQLSFPNWYISLYSGFNAYITENNVPLQKDSYFSAGNSVNTISTVGVGYDISKLFSARAQAGWVKYRWSADGINKDSQWAATATADFMISITRLIADYDPNRTFEFQFFIGGGAAYRPAMNHPTYSSNAIISPVARTGVQASFYLSRRFAVNLDVATNFVSDRMDDVVSRHFSDNYTSVMLGFTYHLLGCNCKTKPHNAVSEY